MRRSRPCFAIFPVTRRYFWCFKKILNKIEQLWRFILDYTSWAGWPRRYFCGWIIPARCNYRALKHLMWRGHHFPGRSRSREIGSQRKVTLGTPFWTAQMALSKGKREFWGPKRDLKTCGRTDERTDERTHTHDFLKLSTQKPLRGKKCPSLARRAKRMLALF